MQDNHTSSLNTYKDATSSEILPAYKHENTSSNNDNTLSSSCNKEVNQKRSNKTINDSAKKSKSFVKLSPKSSNQHLDWNLTDSNPDNLNLGNKKGDSIKKADIEELINIINGIIKKLDRKIFPKKTITNNSKKSGSEADEIKKNDKTELKNYKTKTLDLINDGEEIIKHVFKIKELHKNCTKNTGSKLLPSESQDCFCNPRLSDFQGLKTVLKILKARLEACFEKFNKTGSLGKMSKRKIHDESKHYQNPIKETSVKPRSKKKGKKKTSTTKKKFMESDHNQDAETLNNHTQSQGISTERHRESPEINSNEKRFLNNFLDSEELEFILQKRDENTISNNESPNSPGSEQPDEKDISKKLDKILELMYDRNKDGFKKNPHDIEEKGMNLYKIFCSYCI